MLYFYCERMDCALSTKACQANRNKPARSTVTRRSSLHDSYIVAARPIECTDCPVGPLVDDGKIELVTPDRFDELSRKVGTRKTTRIHKPIHIQGEP